MTDKTQKPANQQHHQNIQSIGSRELWLTVSVDRQKFVILTSKQLSSVFCSPAIGNTWLGFEAGHLCLMPCTNMKLPK